MSFCSSPKVQQFGMTAVGFWKENQQSPQLQPGGLYLRHSDQQLLALVYLLLLNGTKIVKAKVCTDDRKMKKTGSVSDHSA